MTTWNELFLDEKNRSKAPESEIYKFVAVLEKLFSERPLRLWDLCCGAGRHTVLMAQLGHQVYASDNAPSAVDLTQIWLAEMNLKAKLALADMTVCPWPEIKFHGIISWGSLPHNTLSNIRKTIDMIHQQLVPGGLFMGTLKSTKADSYGSGQEIEPNTFIPDEGKEKGIIHHFTDEAEIRELFKKWEVISLAEQVVTYVGRGENFLEYNPFPYTNWEVLARKRESRSSMAKPA
jgi:cyclopropane fatty-acyl-phospholipid synthase-like methyltransferase